MKNSSLILNIQPSRYQAAMGAVIHSSACGAVVLALLPWVWLVGLLAIIIASYAVTRSNRKDSMMRCQVDGDLAERLDDEWLNVELFPETLVWPWLVVLRYRVDGSDRTVAKVIWPDSLGKEDFRRFRVWLRWRSAKPVTVRCSA